ncbi:MAG: Hsp20/alpha crystallin family protein [Gemmatimonadota bacterium]|nr:Hsp20/alpha crystallin family protein [Gemmatimonadota bacterium]
MSRWQVFAGTRVAFPLAELDDTVNSRSGAANWTPALDIRESDKELSLDIELPGIEPSHVDISVENGVLTVRGEKRADQREESEDGRWHVVERSYGSFFRSFQLPQGVDEQQISADFTHGVLTVHVPKSALPQPRKIQIAAEGQNRFRARSRVARRRARASRAAAVARVGTAAEARRATSGWSPATRGKS